MKSEPTGYDAEAVRAAMRRVADKFSSNREWAAKAGIGEATLRKFLTGGSAKMELDKIVALARAAGLTVSQMIGEAPLEADSPTQPPAEDPATRSLLREVRARLSRQTADIDALVAELSRRLDGRDRGS